MYDYEINGKIAKAIEDHVRDRARFVDADLVEEFHSGIGFLYDFGLISLGQYGSLYNLFTATETKEHKQRDAETN